MSGENENNGFWRNLISSSLSFSRSLTNLMSSEDRVAQNYQHPKYTNQNHSLLFPFVKPTYSRKTLVDEEGQEMIHHFQYSLNNSLKIVPPFLSAQNKKGKAKFTIIFFHGNGEDLGSTLSFMEPIRDKLSADLYALQYPNYGVYTAYIKEKQIPERIKRDALQFYDYLQKNDKLRQNVVVIGRSIGTGPGIYLASHKKVDQLILISPFTKIQEIGKGFVSGIGPLIGTVTKWMYGNHFDNQKELKNADGFNGDLFIIHGMEDKLIKVGQGQQLARIYRERNPEKSYARYPMFMTHNQMKYESDILQNIVFFCLERAKQKQNMNFLIWENQIKRERESDFLKQDRRELQNISPIQSQPGN